MSMQEKNFEGYNSLMIFSIRKVSKVHMPLTEKSKHETISA